MRCQISWKKTCRYLWNLIEFNSFILHSLENGEGFGVDKFVPSDEPFNVFDDEDDDDIGMGVSVG